MLVAAAMAVAVLSAPALAGGGNAPGFGRHGVATFNDGFTSTPGTAIFGEAVQGNGAVVLAGSAGDNGGASDVLVTRLTARGTIDRSFGHHGRVELNLGLPGARVSYGAAIALAPDGGSVVAVTGADVPPAVVRLTRTGALDHRFGHGGVVRLPLPGHLDSQTTVSAIAVTRAGAIVVAGEGDFDTVAPHCAFVAELTPRGAPDRRLGGDGVVCPQLDPASADRPYGPVSYANGVRIDARGRIVLVGDRGVSNAMGSSMLGVVARLTPHGALDRSFGVGGTVSMGSPDGEALAIDRSGRVTATGSEQLVVGHRSYGYALVVERFGARGTPDRTFGRAGQRTVLGAFQPTGRYESIAVLADGDLVVTTPLFPNETAVSSVVALTARGSLDRRFANRGIRRLPFELNAVAPAPGGRIVASGAGLWGRDLTYQRGIAVALRAP